MTLKIKLCALFSSLLRKQYWQLLFFSDQDRFQVWMTVTTSSSFLFFFLIHLLLFYLLCCLFEVLRKSNSRFLVKGNYTFLFLKKLYQSLNHFLFPNQINKRNLYTHSWYRLNVDKHINQTLKKNFSIICDWCMLSNLLIILCFHSIILEWKLQEIKYCSFFPSLSWPLIISTWILRLAPSSVWYITSSSPKHL